MWDDGIDIRERSPDVTITKHGITSGLLMEQRSGIGGDFVIMEGCIGGR